MRILYITDDYGWSEYGVKRSLYETLAARVPITLAWYADRWPQARFGAGGYIGKGDLCDRAMIGAYSHIFFASTGLCFDPTLMGEIRAIKVGFGFSDPRHLDLTKRHWQCFDHYFSLSPATTEEARAIGIDAHQMLPSVHPSWHDRHQADHARAEFDVAFFGNVAGHPDAELRQRAIDEAWALGASVHLISGLSGEAAYRELARCRIGLNAMGPASTTPHRIFEYAAANLCVITDATDEIAYAFDLDSEVLLRTTQNLARAIGDRSFSAEIARAGHRRVMRDHAIQARAQMILEIVGGR